MTQRESFERWQLAEGYDLDLSGCYATHDAVTGEKHWSYRNSQTGLMYSAWQAAQAALIAEIVEKLEGLPEHHWGKDSLINKAIEIVRKAGE